MVASKYYKTCPSNYASTFQKANWETCKPEVEIIEGACTDENIQCSVFKAKIFYDAIEELKGYLSAKPPKEKAEEAFEWCEHVALRISEAVDATALRFAVLDPLPALDQNFGSGPLGSIQKCLHKFKEFYEEKDINVSEYRSELYNRILATGVTFPKYHQFLTQVSTASGFQVLPAVSPVFIISYTSEEQYKYNSDTTYNKTGRYDFPNIKYAYHQASSGRILGGWVAGSRDKALAAFKARTDVVEFTTAALSILAEELLAIDILAWLNTAVTRWEIVYEPFVMAGGTSLSVADFQALQKELASRKSDNTRAIIGTSVAAGGALLSVIPVYGQAIGAILTVIGKTISILAGEGIRLIGNPVRLGPETVPYACPPLPFTRTMSDSLCKIADVMGTGIDAAAVIARIETAKEHAEAIFRSHAAVRAGGKPEGVVKKETEVYKALAIGAGVGAGLLLARLLLKKYI